MEFVFAVVWNRTVSYCFIIFTCNLQHQKFLWFILFNPVSCYKCFGHCFIALSTCAETCFVEEGIDSLPVFNSRFCSVTLDFWSVESLEEEGDFLGVSCTFNELLTVPWFFFCFNFWQGLWWIFVSFSYLCELDPNTTSCKICNKFKLHFWSPTKRDSHKF